MIALNNIGVHLPRDITKKQLLRYTVIALVGLVGVASLLQNIGGVAPVKLELDNNTIKPQGVYER